MRINEYKPDTDSSRRLVEGNIKRLNRLMERDGVDALFVITVDNWRYLTGLPVHHSISYATVNAAILPKGSPLPVLMPLDFFASRIRVAAPWYSIIKELPFPGTPEALQPTGSDQWGKLIAEAFVELGIANRVLAIDPGTPWVIQQRIRECLPEATLRDASKLLAEARLIKNDDEVEAIRKACRIADIAIETALSGLQANTPEYELAAVVESVFRRNGAEFPSMMPCIFSGDHPLLGYICSSDRKVQSGELVRIDIGCAVDGYCSCIARTGFAGQPSSELMETYELLREALRAGIDAVRPGVTNVQVHQTMHQVLHKGSSGKYGLDWYGGHGIGLGLHEQPMIGSAGTVTQIVLQPGMVFALEPSVLLPGKGWLGLEDNLVVRPGGAEVLSFAKYEL